MRAPVMGNHFTELSEVGSGRRGGWGKKLNHGPDENGQVCLLTSAVKKPARP
jgi:hypothetical protein